MLYFSLARKESESDWVPVDKELPGLDKTVWLYGKGHIWLGYRAMPDEDGWCWAVNTGGEIYVEGHNIVSEADYEDVDVTHWHPLPEIPYIPSKSIFGSKK